nr:hypothetical protein [Clostridia bacterium]
MNFNITIPPATVGGWISLGILAFAALSMLLGFFTGLKRGFGKTVIRIATIAIAAVVSYFLAVSLTGVVDKLLEGKTIEELATTFYPSYATDVPAETREIINAFDAETIQYILGIFIAIGVAPAIFITCFYIAKAVLMLVYWLLGALLGLVDRHKGFFSTLLGGVMGIVQGAVIAVCVLLPVSGFLGVAENIKVDLLVSESISDESKEKVEGFYAAYLDEAFENPVVDIISENGGDALFAGLTHAEVHGESYDMREKASLFAGVFLDATELKGMDWKAPSPEHQATLRKIVEEMSEDEYMANILAGILRGSSTALTENMDSFPLEEPYTSLFKEAFSIFHDSSYENIEGDLLTMLEVYYIMGDNGIMTMLGEGNTEALQDALVMRNAEGELVIDTIITTLNTNPRTGRLVTLFTKLSISIMADSMGLDESVTETYENVKSGLNETLAIDKEDFETEDEYRDAVNTKMDETLKENGIELEEDVVRGMSDYVVDNYSELDEVTDEQLNDIILSYYSSYIDYVENGTVPDELPEGVEIPEV